MVSTTFPLLQWAMFLTVHDAVKLVAARDEVEVEVVAHDALEAVVVAANDTVKLVPAHDATKAVDSPSLSLRNFSLYFSAKYYGFTKLIQFK